MQFVIYNIIYVSMKKNNTKKINEQKFEKFNQKNDIFNRSLWDESIRSDKTEKFYQDYIKPPEDKKRPEGFSHKDYAFRNAGWFMSDFFSNWIKTKMNIDIDEGQGVLIPINVEEKLFATDQLVTRSFLLYPSA